MEAKNIENITNLLIAWSNGNKEAVNSLFSLVYDELHRMASNYLRKENSDYLLQTTALVNEAYIKLIDIKSVQWQNRAHFFAIAAKAMRQVLVNYAYAQKTQKRNEGKVLLDINENVEISSSKGWDITSLNDALNTLNKRSPRQSEIVELRFFGGLTNEEVGEVLGIDTSTVKRDWSVARAWLACQIQRQ
ncbi:MAG: sigma-70 family RNA polymerase sigma factor [Blastocatellia bacterium]